eukprot:CAMPEP_0201702682 /NCGR_PEP_ID=MMETSP0578-20130828/37294_1 /ASSEMBLY_ACC=CAM_ASM_000663 /TAXON_ID=267565 /ORGANISM="Skeletonema grethea, Strain CCMP 1804" /LENGTH=103 /DNA_ID=CAMNT_0048190305 /DNA_START=157 /DNA_END=468 /DNA_ORIENTATION=-
MRRMNSNRCVNYRLNVSFPTDPSNSAPAAPFSLAQESVERELNRALEYARLMDKQYGICTDPSKNAWNTVDAIYEKSVHNIHRSLPQEAKSSLQGRNQEEESS